MSDNTEEVVRYHTTTHILHKTLKELLGENVTQKGSNITKDRLRFDFSFDRKLTKDEIEKIENLVNQKIKENLDVNCVSLPIEEAKKTNALHNFDDRYPDNVTVYSIGDYSSEFCAGPHVKNTKELGVFKIKKEESVSSGVRRIKAVLV